MRSLYARQIRYLAVCWATMLGVLVLFVLVALPMLAPVAASLPVPQVIVILILLLPFAAAFVVLPGLAQMLATPAAERAAFEAVSAHALLDRDRWVSSAGTSPRTPFRSAKAAKAWVDAHPTVDAIQQARILVWNGEFAEAERVIARLPDEDPIWRAHRAALTSLLLYVRDDERRVDVLDAVDASLDASPPTPQRDYAMLNLAFERARLAHADGAPSWTAFAAVRGQLSRLPAGASSRDRWLSSIRSTAPIVVVIGLVAALVQL